MTSNVAGRKIALGVCGGIAAYKVVEVARALTQAGADVHVVMTPSATNFVGPITFSTLTGNPIRTELFPPDAPSKIPHTDLGRTSDLIVIAPATAKVIAKFAQGISDDLVSALLLSAQCPIVMAPAMHTEMWENDATVANIAALRSRGVRIVGPESGALAGPDVGPGRMSEAADILAAVDEELAARTGLEGIRILITAGGTREPIDAVRYIGNRSSGRMGYAIAFEASRRGAKVTLVTAPSHLDPPAAAEVVRVTTAEQMARAVQSAAASADVIVMAAAVADFRPKAPQEGKIPKSEGVPEVVLEPTTDILATIGAQRSDLPALRLLVGFSAETGSLMQNAERKMREKGADMMVANDVSEPGAGFDVDTNKATILSADGKVLETPLISKRELARLICEEIATRL